MIWFRAAQVSVANGSRDVTVNSGESIQNISQGDALIIGQNAPVEIVRAYISPSNARVIELAQDWISSSQTNIEATAIPASADFIDATKALRDAIDVSSGNFKSIHSWISDGTPLTEAELTANPTAPTGFVYFKNAVGETYKVKTVQKLEEELAAATPSARDMTKDQFLAHAESNRKSFSGSGFVEWGKHFSSGSNYVNINEGLWTNLPVANLLILGDHSGRSGISRKDSAVISVDGVQHKLSYSNSVDDNAVLLFPPAPNGTKTYNSTNGTVTTHASVVGSFAAENNDIKVITSRQDLVFLETWHEALDAKDIVYPLGNVQYGATTYDGIALVTNLVVQAYSAFGEWDTTTTGRGVRWTTLTDVQKAKFLSDPENNIYFDTEADKLIQVRYRVRVIEGPGDDWHLTSPAGSPDMMSYHQSNVRIKTRGSVTTFTDYGSAISDGFSGDTNTSRTLNDAGLWEPQGTSSSSRTHDNKLFAVPIALVQRMNQGAFHPTHNPNGCKLFNNTSATDGGVAWHSSDAGNITTTAQCFNFVSSGNVTGARQQTGNIANTFSGRNGSYEFYDAVYAGQVHDLRLNANKLDTEKLREEVFRNATSGTMRGKGKVPFTLVRNTNPSTIYQRTQASNLTTFKVTGWDNISGLSSSQTDSARGIVQVNNNIYRAAHVYASSSTSDIVIQVNSDIYPNILTDAQIGNPASFIITETELSPEYDSLPWIDIIGDPVRIQATFPNGVIGQWIPQIPDGTSRAFNLNKKAVGSTVERTFTVDDGAAWTFTAAQSINQITNTYTTSLGSIGVMMLQYEAPSDFTEADNNSVIVGSLGNVRFNSEYRVQRGNRLQPSLTGSIGKDNTVHYGNFDLDSDLILDSGLLYGPANTGSDIRHVSIDTIVKTGTVNNTGVKALSSITEKDGLYYLQLHGSELRYQATFDPWGDDDTIPITDNESTRTDTNGATVKTFCHHSQFPIGISNNN